MRNLCFLCNEPSSTFQSLHKDSTFHLDARVRIGALDSQDDRLLAKLSAGDLVAQSIFAWRRPDKLKWSLQLSLQLCRLYPTTIEELGVLKTARVHSTMLTNRISANFPNIRA